MVKIWTWLVFAALVVASLFTVSALCVWYGHLPFDWFFNRAFVQLVLDSPETLSQLRLLESAGIKFHQDDLDDVSIAASDRQLAKLRHIHAELLSYHINELDAQQRLSYDMAEWFLIRASSAADRFRYHDYPVNQLFGQQSEFPSFMESTHQVQNTGDAEDYLSRLSKVAIKWKQLLEGLREREKRGILPPRFVVEKVLAEMLAFVNTPAEQNILHTAFAKKLGDARIKDSEQRRLLDSARERITKDVYPAYQTLIAYFTALLPKTTQDAGVWKLPDGGNYYADLLELYTTTKTPPQEIHALGLSEVARIQAEMRKILESQGYDVTRSLGDTMRRLAQEPRFSFSDDAAGRAQILKRYQQIIDEATDSLGGWFGHRPKIGVQVERVPVFKEKTAPGGYYEPPPLDGSKKGVFYANLFDIHATPKFDMRTLAYHEAVPGHHFQTAIAQGRKELPLFRRMAPFTAYVEGWALYAERLAFEAGLQKDPFDNLGRLQAELLRAARLVVDTGIHKERWTREAAIEYMAANTGLAMTDVVAEVERYVVIPGQACAYMVGMLEILRLREKAKRELAERFDIRAFHDVVLNNGPMPLFLLERVVDEWIKAQKSKVTR